MAEESEAKKEKISKVTPSVLDAFDLLKATKDEDKLNGGAKIIWQLQGDEVRFISF